eukprot:186836-Chlamydomonas_euryale.AAC.1
MAAPGRATVAQTRRACSLLQSPAGWGEGGGQPARDETGGQDGQEELRPLLGGRGVATNSWPKSWPGHPRPKTACRAPLRRAHLEDGEQRLLTDEVLRPGGALRERVRRLGDERAHVLKQVAALQPAVAVDKHIVHEAGLAAEVQDALQRRLLLLHRQHALACW